MKQIDFRPAKKDECRIIAKLYSISSDGLADYVWTRLAEDNESILDVGQKRYENENSNFSYKNAMVATIDNEIIGMIVAFPMHVNPEEIENDPVLKPFSILEEDNSYYICGVAVFPDYRGQGIGSQFMTLAEQHAMTKGYKKLSLIVFEENSQAKKLYDRLGYVEIQREHLISHPLIYHTGDAILMVKTL